MLIRKAEKDDNEAIWKVHTDAIKNVCSSHYTPNQVNAWAGKIKPNSYLESIENKEMFVAEINDEIVGFGQLNLNNGEIEAIYVSSNNLKMGVGQQLFQKLESIAKDNRLQKLNLISSLNAFGFYNRLGFIPRKEMVHNISDETTLECVEMEKDILK
ncbi:GNAT family N-acetyltransferase [Virgibacillus halodenitrificans]|uniref:GNAT family N-acetyltransferase n=1 Tax=Virgibacillus halodenitrificans TaxID=1482 RepID=UPI001F2AB702|nr:GNAT family N-acetyltransferase [Virgibacillus halodenitrificans]MCG1029387.1 GNAT family N-acetyltransferase [Virgibacillus halodenitrificans]